MSTTAQTAANRANAQLSTGPRTTDGKARVSQNATRHGLTSRHLVIREDELEEFTAFQDSLAAELSPQGALETIAFHELLHAAWNLQRFRRMEADVCSGKLNDFIERGTSVILDRLSRYQTRTQRADYRALQELRTLQTNRALRAAQPEESAALRAPAAADIVKLTKQTQSAPARVRPATPPRLAPAPPNVSEPWPGSLAPSLPAELIPA